MRLSPVDPYRYITYMGVSYCHFLSRRNDEAIIWADKALALQPVYRLSFHVKIAASAYAGRDHEMREAMAGEDALASDPRPHGIEKDEVQVAAVDRVLRPAIAGGDSPWLGPDKLAKLVVIGEGGGFDGGRHGLVSGGAMLDGRLTGKSSVVEKRGRDQGDRSSYQRRVNRLNAHRQVVSPEPVGASADECWDSDGRRRRTGQTIGAVARNAQRISAKR